MKTVAQIQKDIDEFVRDREYRDPSPASSSPSGVAVHYNDNGKIFCSIRGYDLQNTTEKHEVSCSYCKRKLTGSWKWWKK